jgi:hypothetical protein
MSRSSTVARSRSAAPSASSDHGLRCEGEVGYVTALIFAWEEEDAGYALGSVS